MPEETRQNSDLKLRSEAVQEILGHVPHWMIRWGNSIILLLVIGILIFSGFLRYPDRITTEILLTTSNPSSNIYATTNGEFGKLLISDNASVSRDQVIATLKDSIGQMHEIKSPISGKVHFLDFWREKTTVAKGNLLFKITPLKYGNYVGKLKVPAGQVGTLSPGQEVRIPSTTIFFPSGDDLVGKISKIASVPDENGNYVVEVLFPEMLDTLKRDPSLYPIDSKAIANIITEDLSLLERLFYQLKDIFDSA